MKRVVSLCAIAFCLCSIAAIPAHSQELNQLLQGREIRMTLQDSLSTATAHMGDPFTATIAEPVSVNGQLVLPVGTKITGVVGAVATPRFFPMFRGQAAMNLTFRNIQIDGREIPVQMSILAFQTRQSAGYFKRRKDIKISEGSVVEQKRDYKGAAIDIAIGGGGGTIAGAILGSATRGLGVGMAVGAVYAVAHKGKQVKLPAQTALLVRLDSTLTLPTARTTAAAAASSTGPNQ